MTGSHWRRPDRTGDDRIALETTGSQHFLCHIDGEDRELAVSPRESLHLQTW